MEIMKKYHISRLFVIALVIVSLVAYSCYTAPKVHAEAFTLTSLFLMLVMSVMATLGVTIISSALQDAIDHLQIWYNSFLATKGFSNLDDYLLSLGVHSAVQLATPIFGAINIGKTVYDAIAEFCSWYFHELGVKEGGDPVGDLGSSPQVSYTGSYGTSSQSYWVDDSTYRLVIDIPNSSSASQSSTLSIPLPSSTNSVTITIPVASISSAPLFVLYNGHSVYQVRRTYLSAGGSSYSMIGLGYGNPAVLPVSNGTLTLKLRNEYAYYYQSGGGSGSRYNSSAGSFSLDLQFSDSVVSDAGFVVAPSDNILSPPSISVGQSYSIPSANTRSDDDIETAINDVVAPITEGGLTKTATVTGTAVPAEWSWLYEGVESIKNNTSDDRHGTDFIPSSTTMDFGFWHYVPDWISSVGAGFSLLLGVVTSLPSIMLAPLYGILVLGIVVALFHKLWGS